MIHNWGNSCFVTLSSTTFAGSNQWFVGIRCRWLVGRALCLSLSCHCGRDKDGIANICIISFNSCGPLSRNKYFNNLTAHYVFLTPVQVTPSSQVTFPGYRLLLMSLPLSLCFRWISLLVCGKAKVEHAIGSTPNSEWLCKLIAFCLTASLLSVSQWQLVIPYVIIQMI